MKDQHTSTRKDMYQDNVQVLLNADKDENIQQIYKNIFDMYKTEAYASKTELNNVEAEIILVQNERKNLELKSNMLHSGMSIEDTNLAMKSKKVQLEMPKDDSKLEGEGKNLQSPVCNDDSNN